MCGDNLPSSMTYDQVNVHIDMCMSNPAQAEEKKRLKKMQSKLNLKSLDFPHQMRFNLRPGLMTELGWSFLEEMTSFALHY